MKCSKCGKEITEKDKYCPSCGTKVKVQTRFSKKLEAENRQRDHQKKMSEKDERRQKKIIEEKGLKNKYAVYPFIFGIAGTLMILWPAGHETQLQWWYVAGIFILGATGYYFAVKANRMNEQYFRRYRVRVNTKLIKAGVYLSAFTILGGALMLMVVIPYYFPME